MSQPNDCGFLIKQIHDTLEKRANQAMRASGLTMAQMNALLVLRAHPEKQMPLKELERCLRVAQSTAAGIVSRLEQKGFVEALGDAQDRRVKILRITATGERCCLRADEDMARTEAKLLAPFTEVERTVFLSLLRKVWDSLK